MSCNNLARFGVDCCLLAETWWGLVGVITAVPPPPILFIVGVRTRELVLVALTPPWGVTYKNDQGYYRLLLKLNKLLFEIRSSFHKCN